MNVVRVGKSDSVEAIGLVSTIQVGHSAKYISTNVFPLKVLVTSVDLIAKTVQTLPISQQTLSKANSEPTFPKKKVFAKKSKKERFCLMFIFGAGFGIVERLTGTMRFTSIVGIN
jgi:hypothetical protein